MKFKPGTLVEIFNSVEKDHYGNQIEYLDADHLGKLCLVYNVIKNHYYEVMPIGGDHLIEVYEQEIREIDDKS